MEKTTAFDFFTAISNGTLTDTEKAYAEAQIAKILTDREKASAKRKAKSAENEPIKRKIAELLAQHPMIASEIGLAMEISTSKASSMCRQMVEDELLSVTEVKSPTSKSKVKQYSLIVTATEVATENEGTDDIIE